MMGCSSIVGSKPPGSLGYAQAGVDGISIAGVQDKGEKLLSDTIVEQRKCPLLLATTTHRTSSRLLFCLSSCLLGMRESTFYLTTCHYHQLGAINVCIP
jgi:hypothetical protein